MSSCIADYDEPDCCRTGECIGVTCLMLSFGFRVYLCIILCLLFVGYSLLVLYDNDWMIHSLFLLLLLLFTFSPPLFVFSLYPQYVFVTFTMLVAWLILLVNVIVSIYMHIYFLFYFKFITITPSLAYSYCSISHLFSRLSIYSCFPSSPFFTFSSNDYVLDRKCLVYSSFQRERKSSSSSSHSRDWPLQITIFQ
jgi:hypothetical protein